MNGIYPDLKVEFPVYGLTLLLLNITYKNVCIDESKGKIIPTIKKNAKSCFPINYIIPPFLLIFMEILPFRTFRYVNFYLKCIHTTCPHPCYELLSRTPKHQK